MPSNHALLGPSSAHRWLVCTPSARLEATLPNSTSKYAEEGTVAHALAASKLMPLTNYYHEDGPVDMSKVDAEMESCTDLYRDIVEEELNAVRATTPDAQLLVEQQLDLSDYVPDAFGTADAVIVSDDLLVVIDFKYGKGVPVDAVGNPQTKLYGLGAMLRFQKLYDFSKVKTIIVQPRLSSVSSEEMTVAELLGWSEKVVRPQAKKADAGEGDYVIGEHCRFCRAAGVCRARAEAAFAVVEAEHTLPPTLNDDEIPDILDKLDDTEKWIAAIRQYAQDKAIRGEAKWRGYKLVEARTQRKISDPVLALGRLEGAGYSDEDVTTVKLKGITELEKFLGKKNFNTILGDIVVKPQGEPVLVKESDRREEINPLETVFKED